MPSSSSSSSSSSSGSAVKKIGDPKKAAKLLGITDVAKLTEAMQAQAAGNDSKAKKLFEEILKKEQMKDKADALMKTLKQAGLV